MTGAVANIQRNGKPVAGAEPGNARAVTHGGHASVISLAPDAQRLREVIAELLPIRASDGGPPVEDRLTVDLLALTVARIEQLGEFFAEHGLFTGRGQLRPAADYERRLVNVALNYCRALGLSQDARARLGLTVVRTVDLANAMSEQDPARRERLLREAGVGDGEELDGGE